MGCPTSYYKEALQSLAYYLICHTDTNLAKELNKEDDIDKLKKFILEKKQNISTEVFLYNAGMASMYTLNNTYENDGCDGFNACVSGLSMFQDFVGLKKDDD